MRGRTTTDTLKRPVTLQQAIIYFSDSERAFRYAVELRWPDARINCPRCGSDKHSFVSTRKIWFCKGCKKQFTVKVGTIFEDSPIGLDKWMTAVWMICGAKNGVSSYEIHRALGVTQKTAWFMLHRIREAMKSGSVMKLGGGDKGPVEVDETFVGPRFKNIHKRRRIGMELRGPGKGKAAVMGMLDRETRQVRAKPDVDGGGRENASLAAAFLLCLSGFGRNLHSFGRAKERSHRALKLLAGLFSGLIFRLQWGPYAQL